MISIEHCPICLATSFHPLLRTKAQMHRSSDFFQFVQCTQCELVFLNPRVLPDKLPTYYTDTYLPYRGSKAWGTYKSFVHSSQHELDQKRAQYIGQQHTVTKDSLILDIGCGNPTFLDACEKQYHCRAFGIDFSDEGWKHHPSDFIDIELFVGQVKDLSQTLRPDIITMWHYLEHDYDPLDTLRRLRRLAHPGTTLIIEVPNYDSESRRTFGEHWAGYHTPRHTFVFSPENLQSMLTKTGWADSKIYMHGTLDPYLLYWMSRMEKKGIDWSKNMEDEFVNFVWGKLMFEAKQLLRKKTSLGIMLAVAR